MCACTRAESRREWSAHFFVCEFKTEIANAIFSIQFTKMSYMHCTRRYFATTANTKRTIWGERPHVVTLPPQQIQSAPFGVRDHTSLLCHHSKYKAHHLGWETTRRYFATTANTKRTIWGERPHVATLPPQQIQSAPFGVRDHASLLCHHSKYKAHHLGWENWSTFGCTVCWHALMQAMSGLVVIWHRGDAGPISWVDARNDFLGVFFNDLSILSYQVNSVQKHSPVTCTRKKLPETRHINEGLSYR